MQFSDLGLKAELLRAVSEQGYDTPTPIQQQAIPAVMTGRDLMATAQTGTGKTAGFTLPILHRLASGPNDRLTRISKTPRVLVLTPTRELAIQVEESVRTYGKHLPINSLAVFGGVGNIDTNRSEMTALVGQSQGATGALQATQAGNQLLALQAQQLADLTAVVAANGRAQSLSEAERAAAAEQGREQRRRFLTPGTGYEPGNARMFPNGN